MSFDLIIDWEEYKTDFRGHEVVMELRPLKRWASLLLTPINKEASDVAVKAKRRRVEIAKELNKKTGEIPTVEQIDAAFLQDQRDNVTEDDINFVYKVQEKAEKVFPEHVRGIRGLTMNKKVVTGKELCEETAFGPLCIDIIGELLKRSQIPENEEKNSAGPQSTPQILDEITV